MARKLFGFYVIKGVNASKQSPLYRGVYECDAKYIVDSDWYSLWDALLEVESRLSFWESVMGNTEKTLSAGYRELEQEKWKFTGEESKVDEWLKIRIEAYTTSEYHKTWYPTFQEEFDEVRKVVLLALKDGQKKSDELQEIVAQKYKYLGEDEFAKILRRMNQGFLMAPTTEEVICLNEIWPWLMDLTPKGRDSLNFL